MRKLIVGVFCLLSGCASVVTKDSLKHMINVDRAGNYIPVRIGNYSPINPFRLLDESAGSDLEKCVYDDEYDKHLKELFDNFEKSGKQKLLIHVHGGLNTFAGSFKRVVDTYPHMLNDDRYPIFVNWRSGPFTSYKSHLLNIRGGADRPIWGKTSAPLYLASDILASVANTPRSLADVGSHSAESAVFRGDDDRDLEDYRDCGPSTQICFVGSTKKDRVDDLISRSIWLATSPIKLLTTSFAFTLGKPVWKVMVRRTRTPFYRPVDFSLRNLSPGDDEVEVICELEDRCTGSMSVFLRKLAETQEKWTESKPPRELEVTVIGHSMGALIVNEMLKHFPSVKFKNIVFMGAAVSARAIQAGLIPYLQQHRNSKFYSLMLHPHNEDREKTAFGALPSGSVLVWLDHNYNNPKTEDDRMFGRWDNAKTMMGLFPSDIFNENEKKNQVRLKVFGLDEASGPVTHGGFTNQKKHKYCAR